MWRLVVNGYLKGLMSWGDSVKCLPCKCEHPNPKFDPQYPFRKLGMVLHSQHWGGKVVASLIYLVNSSPVRDCLIKVCNPWGKPPTVTSLHMRMDICAMHCALANKAKLKAGPEVSSQGAVISLHGPRVVVRQKNLQVFRELTLNL